MVRVLIARAAGGRVGVRVVGRGESAERIVCLRGQADRLLVSGADVAVVCRELGVSESTYDRWRERFGGMGVEGVTRLTGLGKENATLRRLLADAEREKAALTEISKGHR